MLAKQLRDLLADDYRLVVAADGDGSADRMVEVLAEHDVLLGRDTDGRDPLPAPRTGIATVAPLERGFILPGAKLAVLTERDITGRRRAHRPARPRQRDARGFFDDLKEGDYVVHHQHGVARYGGMVRRAIAGHERDYLVLEYRSGDRLYVPSDQIDVVRHYTGGDSPSLSRLNGSDWQKTKARVRSAVAEIAQELVVLYQKRITSPGTVFGPDTPWQQELEAAFPYRETPDQLAAIEAVKADMEAEAPMDRLVCGDVGFGKTEVAIRAAFKAVQEGMQVAILVPTTLLAQQHGQTFGDRFAPYPIRVEVLSRFLTAGQQKAVIEGVGLGTVDVVIGTHRLLSGRRALRQPGPARRGRGAALRRQPQGGHQGVPGRRGRPHPERHADPPDPGDEPDGHPGPVDHQHPARRPPAHPHLRRATTTSGPWPSPSAASCCGRARSSSSTTGSRTSSTWPGA